MLYCKNEQGYQKKFCHIINIHCLPILLYSLESFNISFVQKYRTAVAYYTIIRSIFNFGRFVWIRNLYVTYIYMLAFIGSKPVDIIVDERYLLLIREFWF